MNHNPSLLLEAILCLSRRVTILRFHLGTQEYAQSLYTALGNVCNRSLGADRIGLVAVSSAVRRIGLRKQIPESFCLQRCVIGNGPIHVGTCPAYRLPFSNTRQNDTSGSGPHHSKWAIGGVKLPTHATTDCIITSRDVGILANTGVGRKAVSSAMLEATYGNLFVSNVALDTPVAVKAVGDNELSIHKVKGASCSTWCRFTPLGAVVHMLLPSMSVEHGSWVPF